MFTREVATAKAMKNSERPDRHCRLIPHACADSWQNADSTRPCGVEIPKLASDVLVIVCCRRPPRSVAWWLRTS